MHIKVKDWWINLMMVISFIILGLLLAGCSLLLGDVIFKSHIFEYNIDTPYIQAKDLSPVEFNFHLMEAIKRVESNNGKMILSKNERAAGILQIRPIVIEDMRNWGHNYSLGDRWNIKKSEEIFWIYTDYYIEKMNYKDTFENRAKIWNGGPMGPKKRTTEKYWKKVTSKFKKEV